MGDHIRVRWTGMCVCMLSQHVLTIGRLLCALSPIPIYGTISSTLALPTTVELPQYKYALIPCERRAP
jgi:Na+/serine symporter